MTGLRSTPSSNADSEQGFSILKKNSFLMLTMIGLIIITQWECVWPEVWFINLGVAHGCGLMAMKSFPNSWGPMIVCTFGVHEKPPTFRIIRYITCLRCMQNNPKYSKACLQYPLNRTISLICKTTQNHIFIDSDHLPIRATFFWPTGGHHKQVSLSNIHR